MRSRSRGAIFARLAILVTVVFALVGSALPVSSTAQTSTTTTTTTTTTLPPTTEPPAAPPAEEPPPAPASDDEDSVYVDENLLRMEQERLAELARLQEEANTIAGEIADYRVGLSEINVVIDDVEDRIKGLLEKLEDRRSQLQARAIAAYKGDSGGLVAALLDASTPGDFLKSLKFLEEANRDDRDTIESLEEEKKALADQQIELGEIRKQRRVEIVALEAKQLELNENLGKQIDVLAALPAQLAIAVDGFVLPVVAPYSFVNDWNFPRSGGRLHKGLDMFCVAGSPIRATEDGYIDRMRNGGLGGLTLYLNGTSGMKYYYAHLSAYWPGIEEGTPVKAGDYIAACGNTGNARTTPHHVHIQMQVGDDGPWIPPYPIMQATHLAMQAAFRAGVTHATTEPGELLEVDQYGVPISPSQTDGGAVGGQGSGAVQPAAPAEPVEVVRAPPKKRAF